MNSNPKKGVVKEYDGQSGIIECNNEKYIFTKNDLKEEININDKVLFRGEKVFEYNRAFFIKKDNTNRSEINER